MWPGDRWKQWELDSRQHERAWVGARPSGQWIRVHYHTGKTKTSFCQTGVQLRWRCLHAHITARRCHLLMLLWFSVGSFEELRGGERRGRTHTHYSCVCVSPVRCLEWSWRLKKAINHYFSSLIYTPYLKLGMGLIKYLISVLLIAPLPHSYLIDFSRFWVKADFKL